MRLAGVGGSLPSRGVATGRAEDVSGTFPPVNALRQCALRVFCVWPMRLTQIARDEYLRLEVQRRDGFFEIAAQGYSPRDHSAEEIAAARHLLELVCRRPVMVKALRSFSTAPWAGGWGKCQGRSARARS